MGEIRVLDYNYKNVDISGSIITNPLPSSLRGAGVIIAEGQQQPTLDSLGSWRFLTVGDVLHVRANGDIHQGMSYAYGCQLG